MNTIEDLRPLHLRALSLATDVVSQVEVGDLELSTPCAEWDLGALLGHMIGQNHGFAEAVERGDAPLESFAIRPVSGETLTSVWQSSADHIATAFAHSSLDRRVLLAELAPTTPFALAVVISFQLLDTVVHAWDVATALGRQFRPDDELVGATLRIALRVPDGPGRQAPGATFAPSIPLTLGGSTREDDWERTLAVLGRTA